jgi:hypothetical protein
MSLLYKKPKLVLREDAVMMPKERLTRLSGALKLALDEMLTPTTGIV